MASVTVIADDKKSSMINTNLTDASTLGSSSAASNLTGSKDDPTNSNLPKITLSELAKHNTEDSLWIGINGIVYDLTKFRRIHPGGESSLLMVGGQDATEQFFSLHTKEVLRKYKNRLTKVGVIDYNECQSESNSNDSKVMKKPVFFDENEPIVSSVPYAEMPLLRTGWHRAPWFSDSHQNFLLACREFIRNELVESALEEDDLGSRPSDAILKKCAKIGLLAILNGKVAVNFIEEQGLIGPGQFIEKLPGGLKNANDYDFFHEMIVMDIFAREIPAAYRDGLCGGMQISLPAILQFGQEDVKKRVGCEVLKGEKRSCLAISEPQAGSDVANIITKAVKTKCGKYYEVSGVKKWITGGMFADYFVTAVRTKNVVNKKKSGKSSGSDKDSMSFSGMKGISLLLIPRLPGVKTTPISTSMSKSAGTALVMFEKVKVPVENLLGLENEGFRCIMANFNHERWMIICGCQGPMRRVVQESFIWAMQRDVFGKKLINQPVIRFKLAKMVGALESQQSFLEYLTYQMEKIPESDFIQMLKLGGIIGLCKFQATRAMTMISDESCQIFGGRALTKTGMGKSIEYLQRCFKFASILGGSEEIMADLAIRQAMIEFPKNARL